MRVDFPMPGSPPSKTVPPRMIPPPNTLSNSDIPQEYRKSLPNSTSSNVTVCFLLGVLTNCDFPDFACFLTTSSTKEFQEPQSGQRPSHLVSTRPHWEHTYWVERSFIATLRNPRVPRQTPGRN